MQKFNYKPTLSNLFKNKQNLIKGDAFELNINLTAAHPYYLNNSVSVLKSFCIQCWSQEPKQMFLPKKRKVISVLRSPHVDKKAQDHFEQITFKRVLKLIIPNTAVNVLKLCDMEAALLGLKAGDSSLTTTPFQSVLVQIEVKSSTVNLK